MKFNDICESILSEKKKDMRGKQCNSCKKGQYTETGFHDDMDGVLHCDKCGVQTDRYVKENDKTLNEADRKKNEIVKITASMADLGPKFPFKPGDKVKINKFIGYQGNEEEYEVEKGGKKAILTDTMFESVELDEARGIHRDMFSAGQRAIGNMAKAKKERQKLADEIMKIVSKVGMGEGGKKYMEVALDNAVNSGHIDKLKSSLEYIKKQKDVSSHDVSIVIGLLEESDKSEDSEVLEESAKLSLGLKMEIKDAITSFVHAAEKLSDAYDKEREEHGWLPWDAIFKDFYKALAMYNTSDKEYEEILFAIAKARNKALKSI